MMRATFPLASKRSPSVDGGVDERVRSILHWLEARRSAANREGMARFGICSQQAYGVSLATMRPLIKAAGEDHELALSLWETGWHEARILASFVAEPARVSPRLMDRWARDFDNWAVCDSVCLHLFDRTPHAFPKVAQWSRRRDEFVKRAAFATLAGLAVHDKRAADAAFIQCLPLIEQAAGDPRNFVKKAVNWALRQIGKRNLALHAEATALAERLIQSSAAAPRWIGRDALRELTSPAVRARLSRRR